MDELYIIVGTAILTTVLNQVIFYFQQKSKNNFKLEEFKFQKNHEKQYEKIEFLWDKLNGLTLVSKNFIFNKKYKDKNLISLKETLQTKIIDIILLIDKTRFYLSLKDYNYIKNYFLKISSDILIFDESKNCNSVDLGALVGNMSNDYSKSLHKLVPIFNKYLKPKKK